MRKIFATIALTGLFIPSTVVFTGEIAQASTTCPYVIAHRGRQDANTRAENSLSAYENAWKYVTWAETDVQFTSDNVPVIMHDATVDRTTDGTGTVKSLTYSQFSKLHLKTSNGTVLAEHPPTLYNVLADAHSRGRKVVVELKGGVPTSTQLKAFMSRMHDFNTPAFTRVHSFFWTALHNVKAADSRFNKLDGYLVYATPTGSTMTYVEPEMSKFSVANSQTLKKHGHAVVPWVVNTQSAYQKASKGGANAVYSDNVWTAKYVWQRACQN